MENSYAQTVGTWLRNCSLRIAAITVLAARSFSGCESLRLPPYAADQRAYWTP